MKTRATDAQTGLTTGIDAAKKATTDVATGEEGLEAQQAKMQSDLIAEQEAATNKLRETAEGRGRQAIEDRDALMMRVNKALQDPNGRGLANLLSTDIEALGMAGDTFAGKSALKPDQEFSGTADSVEQFKKDAYNQALRAGIKSGNQSFDINEDTYLKGFQNLELTPEEMQRKFANESEVQRAAVLAKLAGKNPELNVIGRGLEGYDPTVKYNLLDKETKNRLDTLMNQELSDIPSQIDSSAEFQGAWSGSIPIDAKAEMIRGSTNQYISPNELEAMKSTIDLQPNTVIVGYQPISTPGEEPVPIRKTIPYPPEKVKQIEAGRELLKKYGIDASGWDRDFVKHEGAKKYAKRILTQKALNKMKSIILGI